MNPSKAHLQIHSWDFRVLSTKRQHKSLFLSEGQGNQVKEPSQLHIGSKSIFTGQESIINPSKTHLQY